MAGLLTLLPAALRTSRHVRENRDRWADADALALGDAAAVLAIPVPGGTLVWALGCTGELDELLPGALVAHGPGVRWASVPRAVRVPADALGPTGLAHLTSWDRLTADVTPALQPGEDAVERLGSAAEPEVLACLRAANPGTRARPGGPDDLGWWGVRDGDRLVGVVGTTARSGGAVHLHGLGVVPSHRGRGLGSALAAAVTRRALDAGAPWVSLHMYADNAPARRLYAGLGYQVEVESAGYGPPDLPPP